MKQIETYLEIKQPDSTKLILEDSRRITGPGMIWDKRGALIDVLISGFDKHVVVSAWELQIDRVLKALGWTASQVTSRIFEDGVSLVISAPADLFIFSCIRR